MKKNKGKWKQYLPLAFFVAIGGVCGFLMTAFVDKYAGDADFGGQMMYLGLLFIIMYVGIFLHLIIHEAGHLVFGLISGYRFCSFRVFSLMLVKEKEKFSFKRLSIAGTGGQCLMAPPEPVDGRIPVILYNLGGSLTNLIVSAVMFLIAGLTALPLLSASMIICGIAGTAVGLMNGIPLRTGTVDNDGYNALSLGKDPGAMRAFYLQLRVNEEQTGGKRLRDMPDEWFEVPSMEEMKNSLAAGIGVFACNRLMDMHKFSEADELMAKLIEGETGMVGVHRDLLICDRIFCSLISEKGIPEAMITPQLKKFMKQMKDFPSVIRTEYALALLGRKDDAGAAKIRARFDRVASGYPYAGDIESERELLDIAAAK